MHITEWCVQIQAVQLVLYPDLPTEKHEVHVGSGYKTILQHMAIPKCACVTINACKLIVKSHFSSYMYIVHTCLYHHTYYVCTCLYHHTYYVHVHVSITILTVCVSIPPTDYSSFMQHSTCPTAQTDPAVPLSVGGGLWAYIS